MKKLTRILMLFLMAAPTIGHAQSGNYTVTCKVEKPLPVTAKAYIGTYDSAGWHTDSSVIKNGEFGFKGNLKKPDIAYIIIRKLGNGWTDNPAMYATLFLEPANITITSPDSLNNAKVIGGDLNDKNDKLQAELKPMQLKEDSIFLAMRNYRKTVSKEKKASKSFNDSLKKVADTILAPFNNTVINYIKTNPDDLFSLFLIEKYSYRMGSEEDLFPLFDSLSANVKATPNGEEYGATIAKMKATAIGALAPDFTLADTTGKSISLHDFKGKYVLVDFWASWCEPCRAENPNVAKAYAKYQSKGLAILGVSVDKASVRLSWIKAINDDHITWLQVSDLKGFDNAAAKLYHIQSIPQNFLVGPDGKIIAKLLRGENLQDKLAEIFGK